MRVNVNRNLQKFMLACKTLFIVWDVYCPPPPQYYHIKCAVRKRGYFGLWWSMSFVNKNVYRCWIPKSAKTFTDLEQVDRTYTSVSVSNSDNRIEAECACANTKEWTDNGSEAVSTRYAWCVTTRWTSVRRLSAPCTMIIIIIYLLFFFVHFLRCTHVMNTVIRWYW